MSKDEQMKRDHLAMEKLRGLSDGEWPGWGFGFEAFPDLEGWLLYQDAPLSHEDVFEDPADAILGDE